MCWTPEWAEARAMRREELATMPVEVEQLQSYPRMQVLVAIATDLV